MTLISEAIETYAIAHTTQETDLLKKLSRETYLKHLIPQMLSGPLQGAFLSMISQLVKPMNILEIGTFTGYSAICLCAGLQEGGQLYTIDINEELEDIQRKYFKEAGLESSINLQIGDAREIIPQINKEFDLIFLDADKINYLNYYNLVFDKWKSGGVLLADNALWSGKVVDGSTDPDTLGLKAFNEHITADPRVENVLLPLIDGMMMVRKL